MAVNYAYENLFYKDSVEKQMIMTYSGGSITNEDILEDNFDLEETLNSSEELNFGECNSSSISFTVGYYEKTLVGKKLSAKTTPSGGTDFSIGQYNVMSDKPDDNREFRKIIACDDLYDALKKECLSWYNTILPDNSSSVTQKQFRDSLFTFLGITQKTQTLPNDNKTIKRTISATSLPGKKILFSLCQANGCFGKINRSGLFEYVFLEKTGEGLFPSNTLYPSDNLYPKEYGMAKKYTHVYLEGGLKYEDYLVQEINKLIITNSKGDVQVTVGTGNNPYIISDNFLLFDRTDQDLLSIAQNIYDKISGRWYRPARVKSIGNPCIETGDGIRLYASNGKQIDLYVLRRKLTGVQVLFDEYEAKGLQKRANNNNSISAQLTQTRQDIRRIEADYVKTTTLEANYITANQIASEYATITNLNAVSLRVGNIEADYVTANQLSAVDAKFEHLNASKIDTGSMNGSYISAGTLKANRLDVADFQSSDVWGGTFHSTNGFIWASGFKYTFVPMSQADYGLKRSSS